MTGREELKGFLGRIAAGGRSAVIVTSRTDETWLGTSLRRIPVGGLATTEAIEYADQVLAAYPAAVSRRAQRAFAELMEWLNGHPLSMRVVLPYLDTTDPQVLLDGLSGTAALPGRDLLTASLAYSIDHLTTDSRRLLVVLSLFQSVTSAGVLRLLSRSSDVPQRFHSQTRDDWALVLGQAAGVGLLSHLGRGMYEIHPALPAYLAERWRLEEPDDYDRQRAATKAALLDAFAIVGDRLYQQIRGGASAVAFTVIDHHRSMLGSLLGYALERESWSEAESIARPLYDYWDNRGFTAEALGWADRARLTLEAADGTPPQLDDPAGALWLFFVESQALHLLKAHQLDAAERIYLDIQDILQQPSETPQRLGRLGCIYHQLGWVAQDRGLLDDAQEWYLKSLAINEELGNRRWMAFSYHNLGMVARVRRRLDDAQEWCLKSLTIKEELGDHRSMASTYHELGRVAQIRRRLDDAQKWYLKSLTINEELANRPEMADNYHQLGWVAQDRALPDDAHDWYLKSLAINEELGRRPDIAANYHQLGWVAQDRGHLDDAQEWYLKSLAITEELGYRPGMAMTFGKMGLLAEARGRPDVALEWMIRCVALFDEFPHPVTGAGPSHLARLSALLGIDVLERCWHRVTGAPLPPAIRDAIASDLR